MNRAFSAGLLPRWIPGALPQARMKAAPLALCWTPAVCPIMFTGNETVTDPLAVERSGTFIGSAATERFRGARASSTIFSDTSSPW